MERTPPPPRPEADSQLFALCQDHLTREESLLTNLLHSLLQVRDAFCQHNLDILPTLQNQQKLLLQSAQQMAQSRDSLRDVLADQLGIARKEATLRSAALSLEEPERGHLLAQRNRLTQLVREADQLSQQNAALLGYARGFLTCLFASLTGTNPSERYGPQGERHGVLYGSFLEARV
jgi:hypothetical protein